MLLGEIPPQAFALGGAALAGLFLWLSLRANWRKRLIDNLPTCKTTAVFIGTVELKGSAEAETPIRSYLAELPCVYYAWSVQEHWSKTVTETYRDSQGRTHTRTRTESGWTTVAEGGEQTLFYLRDDCGAIRINPAKAKVEALEVFSRTTDRFDPLYYGKGPPGSIMHSDHRRRFVEHAIPLHVPLYVVGHARLRDDVVAPEIAFEQTAPMFLISTRSEERIAGGLAVQFWLLGVLAAIFAIAGWVAADGAANPDEFDAATAGGPLALAGRYGWLLAAWAGVWLLGWVWMAYNSMQDLRQRVRQAWANVDVQLKRRSDLIPRLIEVVAGLRDHERTVQEQIALLRGQAAATAPGTPGPDPRGCLRAVLAIGEAYPQLKANAAFLQLQRQLADTEQRIALAREYFNNIVAFHNARLQLVPDRYICALAGMKPQPFISAEDFERAAVHVKFAEQAPPPAAAPV